MPTAIEKATSNVVGAHLEHNFISAGGNVNVFIGVQSELPDLKTPGHSVPLDVFTPECLSKANYRHIQDDAYAKVDKETGGWFIEGPQYKKWVDSRSEKLYGTGILGAGKTCLSAIIIHDLECRFWDDKETAVLYIYCRQDDKYDISVLLGSLLRQYAERHSGMGARAESFWRSCKNPTRGDYVKILGELTNKYRTLVVIDGLNELTQNGSDQLLSVLVPLDLSLLATSRSEATFTRFMDNASTFGIRAPDDEVEGFIQRSVNENDHLHTLIQRQPCFIADIVERIMKFWKGRYLLTRLQVDSLKRDREITASELRTDLKNIPDNIESSFTKTLQRVLHDSSHAERFLKCVLLWVSFSYRELTFEELRAAVLHDRKGADGQYSMVTFFEDTPLINIGGLICVNQKTQTVAFLHPVAKAFFRDKLPSLLSKNFLVSEVPSPVTGPHTFDPHEYLYAICVDSLRHSGVLRCTTQSALIERLNSNAFLPYSYIWWSCHAQASFGGTPAPVIKFILETPEYPHYIGGRDKRSPGPLQGVDILSPIHVAATFGFLEIVRDLLDSCNARTKPQARTALHIACANCHIPLVELLLTWKNIDIWAKDSSGATPIDYASPPIHSNLNTCTKMRVIVGKVLDRHDIDHSALDANPTGMKQIAQPLNTLCGNLRVVWDKGEASKVLALLVQRAGATISQKDLSDALAVARYLGETRLEAQLIAKGVVDAWPGSAWLAKVLDAIGKALMI